MAINMDNFHPSDIAEMDVREELLGKKEHCFDVPGVVGWTLFDDEVPVACYGILAVPWGMEVWAVTSAGAPGLALFRSIQHTLDWGWSVLWINELTALCKVGYERSMRLLNLLGFEHLGIVSFPWGEREAYRIRRPHGRER